MSIISLIFTAIGLAMDAFAVSITIGLKGKQEETEQKVYIHRGLAARRFVKTFVLADNVEVKRAVFDNGLLHIDLRRKKTTETAKMIRIESPASQKHESM